ncbi:MAG: V-type ATP synthase subunit I [Deltaproteobacteria bacterium]|nr:V-type ATP synthase subunit I [Deltaproteobacteria bacterium]
MFFPERMKRIRLLAHASCRQAAVKKLHELGAVQITDFRTTLTRSEWKDLLQAHPASSDVRRITTQLMGLNRLLDVFATIAPELQEGFFKTLFAPAPPEKIRVEDLSGEALFQEVQALLGTADAAVAQPLEMLEKAAAERAELAAQRAAFAQIASLGVRLADIGQGSFVHSFLGLGPAREYTQLAADIEALAGGLSVCEARSVADEKTCLLVICPAACADEVYQLLRKNDVERIAAGRFAGTPAEALRDIDSRMRELDENQSASRAAIMDAAGSHRSRLKALRELLLIERERCDACAGFARTGQVVAIEGWIIAKQAEAVARELESALGGLAAVFITEPDEPEEKLPVALNNPGILKHFELLVKLYAPPKYNEIDPTVLIVPTFLFFFGLMITDAVYGLMTLLLGIFILRGGGKYYPLYKSCGIMLALGGASTIVLGALTGGWLGNLFVDYLGLTFFNSMVVINPMVDVSDFLVFAIAVGVLHLNVGAVVGIIKDVRCANVPSALKNVWIFFMEISLICYYYKAQAPALVFGVLALVFLLYSAKGMALFGLTGFLGDSLSYARLMALGLVSFGLAVAINALAKMVWGIDYVGWLIALLILIGGHLFSFVLNLMGAFAHGIRLHFVEFFGKFYEGGGEDFTPFSIKRRITEL